MRMKSINPADQSIVGEVEVSTKQGVEKAVKKAKEAFKTWRNTSIEKRASYIDKFAKEILRQKEEVARLSTMEMGKPLRESLDDVDYDQDYLKFYTQEGPRILQDEIIEKTKKTMRRIVHEPIGVCAVITPWNFPFGMPIWGIMPNLVAGNTVVFKPSENTPLCGQEVVDIFNRIGLPEGVVNIVQGNGKVGAMLVNSDIDIVWFTGSTSVGQEIYKKCARKFIRCLLELGGSSPAIVMADADIDSAVKEVFGYRFLNCGQVCDAIKRLFVHQKIYKNFVTKLVERVKKAKAGNPLEKVDFGPLVSKKQLALLEAQVEDAINKGAKVETGGDRPKNKSLRKGNYYLPTILTNVNFNMRVLTEEVFGPVLPVIPFDSINKAIEMANRTEYGLTAQVYTQNLKVGRRIAYRLEAGTVSINSSNYFSPDSPFGGYKKSGIGREGGKYGFFELTQIKYVYEKLV